MENKISLYDFLVKFTDIPIKVIKKHLIFYDMCENNPFGINLEDVIKYLDIKKRESFLKRIRNKYQENIDYIKVTNKKFSKKGEIETFYYITLDVFENICMLSRSKNGDNIRDYFITMR